MNNNIDGEFFEAKYQAQKDPWKFASSEYELQRYNHIFSSVAHKRYNIVFEAGCSIGILTEKLAKLAEHVEAFDISPTAVNLAKNHCLHLKNVSIACNSLLNARPNKHTDLLILSEIGYYFDAVEWELILKRLLNCCANDATLLACHWLGESSEHILSGDCVHAIIEGIDQLKFEYGERNANFRLDRWVKI